jgi:hypothetical protein
MSPDPTPCGRNAQSCEREKTNAAGTMHIRPNEAEHGKNKQPPHKKGIKKNKRMPFIYLYLKMERAKQEEKPKKLIDVLQLP